MLYAERRFERIEPMPEIRPAAARDMPSIHALLQRAELPTSDLATSGSQFLIAFEGRQIVAAGALERFGASALLRSVVVVPELRGGGLGHLLVRELERVAQAAGIERLVLLTLTAKSFFEHQRYEVISRADAPADIQQSQEFRSLCPASATCMAKVLATSAK
jgi:amino-acid N-acetyltransferase